MPKYNIIQFIDGGWEIYLGQKIVTDLLRQYTIDHDEPLTKWEAEYIVQFIENENIDLEIAA